MYFALYEGAKPRRRLLIVRGEVLSFIAPKRAVSRLIGVSELKTTLPGVKRLPEQIF